jgi:hypothetical protein
MNLTATTKMPSNPEVKRIHDRYPITDGLHQRGLFQNTHIRLRINSKNKQVRDELGLPKEQFWVRGVVVDKLAGPDLFHIRLFVPRGFMSLQVTLQVGTSWEKRFPITGAQTEKLLQDRDFDQNHHHNDIKRYPIPLLETLNTAEDTANPLAKDPEMETLEVEFPTMDYNIENQILVADPNLHLVDPCSQLLAQIWYYSQNQAK